MPTALEDEVNKPIEVQVARIKLGDRANVLSIVDRAQKDTAVHVTMKFPDGNTCDVFCNSHDAPKVREAFRRLGHPSIEVIE